VHIKSDKPRDEQPQRLDCNGVSELIIALAVMAAALLIAYGC
jgi:hypothetical protein